MKETLNELRCKNCNKKLGEAEGTDYKILLKCNRCKKIWMFRRHSNTDNQNERASQECR